MGEECYITELVLRRYPSSYFKALENASSVFRTTAPLGKGSIGATVDMYMCRMKLAANRAFLHTPGDCLLYIADWLGANPRQLMLLSESLSDYSGATHVQFLMLDYRLNTVSFSCY